MGMEVLGADITPGEVKNGTEGESTFQIKMIQGPKLDEPFKFGLVDSPNGVNGEAKEVDHVVNANFPKDAVDEWPAPKQIHTFYFVKYRSYDDPKLKAKIEQADKDVQKKNQARFQITEELKAKRYERSQVISQLKPLTAEDKSFRMIVDGKRKEMEPLQAALGKLCDANNAVREKGVGLCSSEEELNDLIRSLHYRIQHESNTLVEEKQLLKEIKQLEGTREKVIANASMKAKVQDSLGQREAIQDQVKLIGVDLDGVRKEKQAVRTKIKHLEEELKAIDDEINSLQVELAAMNEKKDKAYEILIELRKARDEANSSYFQNRSLLNSARDLAAKKDITALEGLSHSEVEKFMSQWSSSRNFRGDYEKRILPSLDSRQLSRDGRMRNPDEKPILSEASAPTESETAQAKVSVKRAKEDLKPSTRNDIVSTHKAQDQDIAKLTEREVREKVGGPENTENTSWVEKSQKESKSNEIDAAKLKEMKREEDIAKAKLALERKKKLAEKAAAKAVVRAQKEAEKKLKEKEKRAKKKAGASLPPAEQIETDLKVVEPEEANLSTEAPALEKNKDQKEKVVRHRSRSISQDQVPKIILKRKKSHSYWIWAAPAIVLVLVLMISGYYFSFGRN